MNKAGSAVKQEMFGPRPSLLRNRNFMLLWIGQSISLLGDQFYYLALPWQVLMLTGSTTALGTVLMLSTIPRLALMAVGGVFTDRFKPRSVMLASDILRAIIMLFLWVLALSEHLALWHLLALSVVFGTVDAFFYPASTSIIPGLVDKARLQAANSLMQAANQTAFFLGPALAGALVAKIGTGAAFLVNGISFIVSTVTLLGIVESEPLREMTIEAAKQGAIGLIANLREGLKYILGQPFLYTIILVNAFLNLGLTGPTAVGLPQLARGPLHAGAQGFGLLVSAFGLGSLIGAVGIGILSKIPRRGLLSMGLVVIGGPLIIALAFIHKLLYGMALLFALGVILSAVNVLLITLLQSKVESQLLGRVMSWMMLGSMGSQPVSYALSGIIGDLMGVQALFLLGGATVSISALIAFFVPAMRSID